MDERKKKIIYIHINQYARKSQKALTTAKPATSSWKRIIDELVYTRIYVGHYSSFLFNFPCWTLFHTSLFIFTFYPYISTSEITTYKMSVYKLLNVSFICIHRYFFLFFSVKLMEKRGRENLSCLFLLIKFPTRKSITTTIKYTFLSCTYKWTCMYMYRFRYIVSGTLVVVATL